MGAGPRPGARGWSGRVRRALRPADGRGRRHRGRGAPRRRARAAWWLDPRRGIGDGPGRRVAGGPGAPGRRCRLRPGGDRAVAAYLPRPPGRAVATRRAATRNAERGGLPDGVRPGRLCGQRDDPARTGHRARRTARPGRGAGSGGQAARRLRPVRRARRHVAELPGRGVRRRLCPRRARGRVALRVVRPAPVHRRRARTSSTCCATTGPRPPPDRAAPAPSAG